MEFLVPWWWGFFSQRIILFRETTIIHIFILLPKPIQNFPKRKAIILRIAKNESKKVLEKCDLQCQNAGTLSSSKGHRLVHAEKENF